MTTVSTDFSSSTLAQQQQQVKIPAEILIQCKALDTRTTGILGLRREWGWQCTADEPALKFKSDHTVWSSVGAEAEQNAKALVRRDARNHLPNDQYDIQYIETSLHRHPRFRKVGEKIEKILFS